MLLAKPLAIAGSAAAALVLAFGAGWTAQGWRKDAEISGIESAQAKAEAATAKSALADLAVAASVMKTQAEAAQTIRLDFAADIGILSSELKNEIRKNNPLPFGCLPDAGRVRSFDSAIDAANKAIAR